MSSASLALQQAIFAALSANTDLQGMIGDPPRLFDFVPRDSAFPYVVIGDGTETNWSTATEAGSEHAVVINVWSRAAGHKEAKEIAEIVRSALDNAALSLTGFALVGIRHLATEFARQPDGQTWRATLRFRAVTEVSE